MKIAIFGLGYVGMTVAGCLAREGHHIVGIDVSEEKVGIVNAGKSPIAEPGLEYLVANGVRDGILVATTEAGMHLDDCDLAIVCVGTPSAPDGSHNMSFIAEVTRQIALLSADRKRPLTVAYRSTMRPGTIEELIAPMFSLAAGGAHENMEIVYNPEFLREGVAIEDFFSPPKVVIGTKDAKRCAALDTLNANMTCPIFYTSYREAELTKFIDNTFHALKIAFANEIGRVCGQIGVSARTIHEIFVSDTKLNISPYYLRPGGAFGGSCLPKDVRALQYIAADAGAHTHLIDSLLRTNEAHKHYLFERCTRDVAPAAKVLMLGLAFKAHSDDLRESPNIDLARKLLAANYDLSIYDPHIVPSRLLGQNLGYAFSNLPTLRKLLISKEAAENCTFDLVVDTRGWAKKMSLRPAQVADIYTLT